MRLFTKIFLLGMLVFGLAFSVSGYFLLHYSLESSMAREVDFALKQYQYDKFTVQSAMLTYSDVSIVLSVEDEFLPGQTQVYTIRQMFPQIQDFSGVEWTFGVQENSGEQWRQEEAPPEGQIDLEEKPAVEKGMTESGVSESLLRRLAEEISVPVAFFSEDKIPIYSEIEGLDTAFFDGLSEDAHVYQFRNTPGGGSVLVGSRLQWKEMPSAEYIGDAAWEVAAYGEESVVDAAGDREESVGDVAGDGEERAEYVAGDGEENAGDVLGDVEESTGDTIVGAEVETWYTVATKEESTWDIINSEKEIVWDTINTAAEDQWVYFVTEWDISKTIRQQDTMQQYFVRCYLFAMAAGMVLLGILSAFLTGPLKRMSRAARRMAEGDYQERFARTGKDEIGALAVSFNQMADAVEEKIGELSRAAREKEDFVANFAHELKTPLTSIIGYADTMYQKELPREEIRKASWHIWNEGMRLEALSLKLMELTILGRQDFPLQEMSAEELLRDVAEGLMPLLEEKGIAFQLQPEAAYVRADYDLLKTLLINLVDNAVKAGSSRIEMSGQRKEEKYWIYVEDDGCGMEEGELSRITEAFYMVDKARSRKQHGAGLGLALADRIARIHGGELGFESRKGFGTRVSLSLMCERDFNDKAEKGNVLEDGKKGS